MNMKRKLLLTFAMSTLFASSQLAFLPLMSAHAAVSGPQLTASSSATTIRGGNLEALIASKKVPALGNSEGFTDIQELGAIAGIKFTLPIG